MQGNQEKLSASVDKEEAMRRLRETREQLAVLEQRKAQMDALLNDISELSQKDDSLSSISALLKSSASAQLTRSADRDSEANRKTSHAAEAAEEQTTARRNGDAEDEDDESASEEEEGVKQAEVDAAKRRLERLEQLSSRFQQLRSTPSAGDANGDAPDRQRETGQSEALDELTEERDRLLSLHRRLGELRNLLPKAALLNDDELVAYEQAKVQVADKSDSAAKTKQVLPAKSSELMSTTSEVDLATLSTMSTQLADTTALCEKLASGQQRLHSMLSTLVPRNPTNESSGTLAQLPLSEPPADVCLSLSVAQCQQNLVYQHAEIQQLKVAVEMLLDSDKERQSACEAPDPPARQSLAFDTLREDILTEAGTFIAQNESTPQYLVELFSELRRLRNDSQRLSVLRAVRECVLSSAKVSSEQVEQDTIARFVDELVVKLSELLGRLTAITTVAAIAPQLKTYVIDKLEASAFCSLLPAARSGVSDHRQNRFLVAKVDATLASTIDQFSSDRVCDCRDILLREIAAVLRIELNSLRLRRNLNNATQ